MAALFCRRELVFEVDRRGASFDHRFHQFVRVERSAEAGFRIRHNGSKPVGPGLFAFGGFNLVGAQESTIDTLHQVRRGIAGIKRLVGINISRRVVVRCHLPAAAVDRLQSSLHHFNRLISGDRTQRGNVRLGLHQVPQTLRAQAGQRVLNLNRAAQPQHLRVCIRARDSGPAWIAAPMIYWRVGFPVSASPIGLAIGPVRFAICCHCSAPCF